MPLCAAAGDARSDSTARNRERWRCVFMAGRLAESWLAAGVAGTDGLHPGQAVFAERISLRRDGCELLAIVLEEGEGSLLRGCAGRGVEGVGDAEGGCRGILPCGRGGRGRILAGRYGGRRCGQDGRGGVTVTILPSLAVAQMCRSWNGCRCRRGSRGNEGPLEDFVELTGRESVGAGKAAAGGGGFDRSGGEMGLFKDGRCRRGHGGCGREDRGRGEMRLLKSGDCRRERGCGRKDGSRLWRCDRRREGDEGGSFLRAGRRGLGRNGRNHRCRARVHEKFRQFRGYWLNRHRRGDLWSRRRNRCSRRCGEAGFEFCDEALKGAGEGTLAFFEHADDFLQQLPALRSGSRRPHRRGRHGSRRGHGSHKLLVLPQLVELWNYFLLLGTCSSGL